MNKPGIIGSLVLPYCALAYGLAWLAWGAAWLLGGQNAEGGSGAVAGALLLVGTLAPFVATYALYPRLCAWGLVVSANPEEREGFWRYAFGLRPTLRGICAFAVLFVWRWAMFNLAFGFPSLPDVALNVAASWPVLLLGGGFEEVGWRGCLQPALERMGGRGWNAMVAPLLTGLIWGFWHLPLFAIPGTFQSAVPLWTVLLVGVALSFSFGALHRTSENVVSCIASHAWYNAMLVAIPSFGPIACSLFLVEAVGGAVVLARPWYSDVS